MANLTEQWKNKNQKNHDYREQIDQALAKAKEQSDDSKQQGV